MSEKTLSSSPLNTLTSELGYFQLYWSHFEFYLEVISHGILQTSGKHTSIIFSGLSFKGKQQIAVALLKEQKTEQADNIIKTIREIVNDASRNHLIHSSLHFGGVDYAFSFVKRNIDNGFAVKKKQFTTKTFGRHVDQISPSVNELKALANLSDDILLEYAKAAYGYDE